MRVKKERKPIEKTCIECKATFIAYGQQALRCPICRKKVAREQIKDSKSHWLRSHKIKKSLFRPPMTISEVIQEQEKYNKIYKTRLSYGQYVSLFDK